MKNLLLVPAIALVSLTFPHVAKASDLALSLCEYVSVDDKKRLRSFLKSNNLKIRNVFEGVQCNGQNLLEFAGASNAVETGELMINKLPKSTVQASLAAISNSQLIEIANKRVNS